MPEEHEYPINPEEFSSREDRDFLYNPKDKEVIIFSEEDGERKEQKHPFQEFLYGLREEGLKVSTSEWVDLQKLLAEGEVGSVDDLYVVSRAVLVKDVSDYPGFDTVFGRMFFDVEPPEPDEDEEDYYDEEDEHEEQDVEQSQDDKLNEAIQKEQEDVQEVTEATSKTSEDVHGGDEATKDIENSPNAANEGMQKDNHGAESGQSPENQQQNGEGGGQEKPNAQGGGDQQEGPGGGKQNKEGQGGEGSKNKEDTGGKTKEKKKGGIRKGKGGSSSAKERVVERRYDQFDKDKALNYDQIGRALGKLRTVIQESSEIQTGKLDSEATVRRIADRAGIPELVWREEVESKSKVILMFDVGGSTDDFRPIMEKLFAGAQDYLDDIEVYYFHNAIYGEVWPQKDGNWAEHHIPLSDILKKDADSKVIIVGDAWMADYELWEDAGDQYEDEYRKRKGATGMESFQKINDTFEHTVWVNPIFEHEQEEWDNSGTIRDLKEVFTMYDLSVNGIEGAVKKLMEE